MNNNVFPELLSPSKQIARPFDPLRKHIQSTPILLHNILRHMVKFDD